MRLDFADHRSDPAAWARELEIPTEAVELYLSCDVLDLHIDSFIWTRIFGYDLRERHDHGLLGATFYSQVDLPRALEANLTGATWVITTNPFKVASERHAAFVQNLAELKAIFASVPEQFSLVKSTAEYRAARAAGKHGAFLGVQGGNAFDVSLDALDVLADGSIIRVTLVHLTSSSLGATSSPLRGKNDPGLTAKGKAYVEKLQSLKVFVDLAHVSRKGFWDAVDVADRSQPLIVTHTGVTGVNDHWRNLDDDQVRAIAKSGGTMGVMYEPTFLGDPKFGGKAESIVRHLEHICEVAGDDHASLGSDWDGAIATPRDMKTCLELPRLVAIMLERKWTADRVRKVLGANFLRVVEALRG